MRFGRFDDTLILAVETDGKQRMEFASIAKSLKLRANCVGDFRDAVDCMTSSAYSFLFISVGSADVETFAFIKSLRLNSARLGRSTPIVAMVSSDDPALGGRLKACGVTDVIAGPLTREKLQSVLSRERAAVA